MIIIGDKGKLEIDILRRSNLNTNDYWDGNWLESKIKIDVLGFNAIYKTNLRVEDLQRFHEALVMLQNGKTADAEFTTMEEGLYLHCRNQW